MLNLDSIIGGGGSTTSQKTHDIIISVAKQRLANFNKIIAEQVSTEDKEYANLQMTIAFYKAEIKKIQDSKLLSLEERIGRHLQKQIAEAEKI